MYHGVSGPMYQRGGQRTGGASLSLNFLAGRLDPRITFTRGSTATYRDSTGTRQTAAINAARFDYSATGVPLGLLIEESRQNVFLASGAPATQTVTLTAGNWTVWMEGTGSITSSAGTATATGYGAASAGTPNVINVTVGGTVILTVSGSPTIAQCENGAFATSYIPTAGTSVTRSADSAVISTLTPWFDTTQGTIYVEYDANVANANWCPVSINTDGNNYIRCLGNTTTQNWQMTSGGVNSVNIARNAIVTGTVYKSVFAYANNDTAESLNGAVVGTDNTATVPTMNRMDIGQFVTAQWEPNGHIRRIAYWPSRLPNAQLQALTA